MLPQEARLRGGIVVWLLRCVDTVRYVVCLHGKTTRVFFPSSPVFCFGVGVFARFALLSLAMVVARGAMHPMGHRAPRPRGL